MDRTLVGRYIIPSFSASLSVSGDGASPKEGVKLKLTTLRLRPAGWKTAASSTPLSSSSELSGCKSRKKDSCKRK